MSMLIVITIVTWFVGFIVYGAIGFIITVPLMQVFRSQIVVNKERRYND